MVTDSAQLSAQAKMESISIIATVALLVILAILAYYSARNAWILTLALSVGGIGGLVHELAQSRGKILFFRKEQDGLYLGSIAGIVLGGVAGVLTIRGFLADGSISDGNTVQVVYEVFLAGLALKGVVEAAGGNPVPSGSS